MIIQEQFSKQISSSDFPIKVASLLLQKELTLDFVPSTWANNLLVTLDVKGMTCPLCVSVVNQALRKTDGVIKAKANLKNEQAVVTVPENFNLDELIKAVDATGYKGSINRVEKQG